MEVEFLIYFEKLMGTPCHVQTIYFWGAFIASSDQYTNPYGHY